MRLKCVASPKTLPWKNFDAVSTRIQSNPNASRRGSKSSVRKDVRVRLPPSALTPKSAAEFFCALGRMEIKCVRLRTRLGCDESDRIHSLRMADRFQPLLTRRLITPGGFFLLPHRHLA